MPVAKPEIVVVMPLPVVVTLPGVLVNVQVPDAGKLLRVTLPVVEVHEGCTMVPIAGAVGVAG